MTINLNRIKAERIANGLTQNELAQKLQWSRSKYSKRENGEVPIGADELALIASVLNVPRDNMGIFFDFGVSIREQMTE